MSGQRKACDKRECEHYYNGKCQHEMGTALVCYKEFINKIHNTPRTELTANEKIALGLTWIWASTSVREDSVKVVYGNFINRLKREDK